MKPINIILTMLALALLASCSSDSSDEPKVIVPQDATLTLSVAPGSVLTKSSPTKAGAEGTTSDSPETKVGEARINNIFAALFKADNSLLTSAYVDYSTVNGETPDTIRISAKSDTPYTYVVLVNAGNQSSSTLDDLKTLTYKLQDIKVDNQPMCSRFMEIGKLKPGANYIGDTETFPNAPADAAFYSKSPIQVYRTASRIDFEQIEVDWSEADAADLKKANARFRLKRVFVTDVKASTYLVDQDNDNSVELPTTEAIYLNGREAGKTDYLASLDLFTADGNNAPVISLSDTYIPQNEAKKWQCYITENTEDATPTTILLKGDILPEKGDTPILSDRYFFIRLTKDNMTDTSGKKLQGVIRNYVVRIRATVTGKGSDDETYRDNAYATVRVTPDNWEVEETQHEGVN